MKNFTFNAMLSNINEMNEIELTRLYAIIQLTKQQHFNDEFGITNALFENMKMTIEHRVHELADCDHNYEIYNKNYEYILQCTNCQFKIDIR